MFRRRKVNEDAGRGGLAVFGCFVRIGATAFGGGSATIVAMRQAVTSRGWLSEQQFLDTVVLSRLTPGITILAQVLLIGKQVCGVRGMLAAALGMLAPSVTITLGLAELYDAVSGSAVAATPLRCVAGVAAGFALALAVALLRDTLKRSPVIRGPLTFAGFLALAVVVANPLLVLLAAIAAGVAVPAIFDTRMPSEPGEAGDEY
jgi:chromate transporter